MIYTVHITVMPLKELLHPQGKAVQESLHNLNMTGINSVRIGKHITLSVEADSENHAIDMAKTACEKMLYNPVMESYHMSIDKS